MSSSKKPILIQTSQNTSPVNFLTSSQFHSVLQTGKNMSDATYRLNGSSRDYGGKGGSFHSTHGRDVSIDKMSNFVDFGFKINKRKISEKLGVSRNKLSAPGKQDITKRILNALQKDPSKTNRTDADHTDGTSCLIRIRE